MRFIHQICVLPEEVDYVVQALKNELPPPFTDIDNFDSTIGGSVIQIETDDPLTLEQRRFLTGCGFSVTSESE